ncbi:MAG: tetratricopeptide repeat protein [Angustibacter sp.]
MSQPSGSPAPTRMPLRGAVDLAAVAAQAKARQEVSVHPLGAPVVDATEADFQQVVIDRSLSVPVVVDLWATWCQPCTQLSPVLERLAQEYDGRFLLAKVDVDANPRLAQAFQAQSIPMVVAVVRGQPVPLFQGALPEQQVRAYLDELLRVAAANGVTGTVATTDTDSTAQDAVGSEAAGDPAASDPAAPLLPPLHAQAYEAIERGDLDAAAQAYRTALDASPADADARAGLAQVELMRRTASVDQQAARDAAAARPTDPAAQILVADLDLMGGHVEDAFARLVDAVRVTTGADRDAVRTHLVELFEVVGNQDPRVTAGRRALTSALF